MEYLVDGTRYIQMKLVNNDLQFGRNKFSYTILPHDIDLNNILEPGIYLSPNSDYTNTLSNLGRVWEAFILFLFLYHRDTYYGFQLTVSYHIACLRGKFQEGFG